MSLKKVTSTIITAITPQKLIDICLKTKNSKYAYAHFSYSQEGEDMVLARIFKNKMHGFYIDIGAHHPQRFSNTYYFYQLGWRGINIDAMPGSMRLFDKIRSEDINLEVPISDNEEKCIYYCFNDPAYNNFSKELSHQRAARKNCHIVAKKKLQTKTLAHILAEYLPQGQIIDFLSVDVEGFELKVLKSNDWQKYRPQYVVVEDLNRASFKKFLTMELYHFMAKHDYEFFSKTLFSYFFKDILL